MFLRISSALVAILHVSACVGESSVTEGDKINCAIGAGAGYSDVCTLEPVSSEANENATFLLHSPDGSFRRVSFDREQKQWSSTDGADGIAVIEEQTSAESGDGHFILTIAGDRYIVPWTILADGE
ncbi:MAG: hypothetical protein AAF941_08560 [Pseudomonadota bacterium]